MQLSLGTGLALGRLRRPGPAPRVPALLRPPGLAGTDSGGVARIGAALRVDPGAWSGAERLAFAWLRDGAPIPGAEAARYTPRAADDRAALACRVTAFGVGGGRAAAETPAVFIAFPPPLLVGSLPDLDYTQGTGPHIMNASPFFTGSSLVFGLTGEGVAVDPATGLLTVDAAALRAGVSVRVTATNSGGVAETSFRLTVTAAPVLVPPVLIAAPTLAGSGRVGEALAVEPGAWAGDPAPDLALQWLCDGAPIAGATDGRFTPGAAEDGAGVTCRVTASNSAGSATAETGPVSVTQAPPAAVGKLADVVLALEGAGLGLPAAGAFAGASLRFSVAGAGAGVDPETGVVAIPAGTPRAAEFVTVTATNSGGAATQRFAVTVLAAPAALAAPAPTAFAQGSGPQTIAAAAFFAGPDLAFALDAAPAGVTIDRASGRVTVPTAAALQATLALRATNLAGAATQRLALRVLAAPTALVAPEPVVFVQGSGSKTIAAAAFFSGPDLAFVLDAAPAGVTIDRASGRVTVPTAATLEGRVTIRATNAVGAATQSVAVSVRANVVPLANAALPTFTPRVAPGTRVGSVWDIGDGAWTGGVAPFATERSVFRGTTQIVPYGAAASYTIVAADQGPNAITARVRRTDSSVPPQIVTVTSSGAALIPAEPSAADYTVDTAAELLAAMIAAAGFAGPKRIIMRPGDYGLVRRTSALVKAGQAADGTNAGNRVTVTPSVRQTDVTSAANRVQFLNGGLDFSAGGSLNGFTFDNLWFADTRRDSAGVPNTASKPVTLNNARNVTFRNCMFTGGHRGISTHQTTTNLVIEWCEFRRCGMDSISLYNTTRNAIIQNNHFHDPDIDHSRSQIMGRHPDASSVQGPGCTDIVYRGNFYDATVSGYWQGIFVTSPDSNNSNWNDNPPIQTIGLTIERNWLEWHNYNGFAIRSAAGVLIQDNVLRHKGGGGGPKMVLRYRVEGVIQRNVTSAALVFDPAGSGRNMQADVTGLKTNVVSDTATPAALPRPEPHGIFGYE